MYQPSVASPRQPVVSPAMATVPLPAAAVPVEPAALDIASAFLQHLQPQMARTEGQRREVYRLRHQVYAEELAYEPERPDRQETDAFDARSQYATVRHRRSGRLAGTVRLVSKHRSDEPLPLEAYCAQALNHASLQPRHFAPHQVCEISRLAVPAAFRKQQADALAQTRPAGGFTADELRSFPHIAVGLYMAAVALSCQSGRFHVFVMMEPRLARALGFVGIRFLALGEPIDYHGKRAAYYIDSRRIFEGMVPAYQDLLQRIEASLYATPVVGQPPWRQAA